MEILLVTYNSIIINCQFKYNQVKVYTTYAFKILFLEWLGFF